MESTAKQKEAIRPGMPPHDDEAERGILGGILIDNDAYFKISDIIDPEDFYRPAHRIVYQAMVDLSHKKQAVDLVTLASRLRDTESLDQVGGPPHLAGLIDAVPTAAHIEEYAEIVVSNAIRRAVISSATEVVTKSFSEFDTTDSFIDYVEHKIFSVTHRRKAKFFTPLRQIVHDTFQLIETLYEQDSKITGIASGFDDLDEMTAGFQNGDLFVVAARPSMGKTSFVLNVAAHSAIHQKKSVVVFSLEMSKEQLVLRLITALAQIDAHNMRVGKLKDTDWPKLTHAAGVLSEASLFIDDTPAITIQEIRTKCRRLKMEGKLDMIIIDYMQLMRVAGRVESREREISEISRSLKALAKELTVPVIALSQLNRSLESRNDKRPLMSDLRECVTGDTLVVLSDGRRVPIRELVGKTPEVVSVDKDGKLIHADSDKVWSVGKKPVYRVCLASGREIKATGKHRLFGSEGWCYVSDLKLGSRLAISRFLPEPKQTGSSHFRFSPSRSTMMDYASILDDDYLKKQCVNDLFWDRVISIEPAGEEEVYDLTVPGPASWLADSIVSHNSGAIEQDSDVIAFIYRDEVYNKDTDEKGVAEIILSKQRNGPTGVVRLAWLPQYTSFKNLASDYVAP